jgi:hypothetical protein
MAPICGTALGGTVFFDLLIIVNVRSLYATRRKVAI